MRAKLLAVALLAAAPAHATTYTYESGLYTYNANAHPELFGDRLTGSVTFMGDTSHYTGRLSAPAALSLTSGIYTISGGWPGGTNFTFDDGNIVGWYVGDTVYPCGFSPFTCVIETGSTHLAISGIYHQCFACADQNINETAIASNHGGWTMVTPVQVPGPVVGAGVPALMMLIAWLMAKRR